MNNEKTFPAAEKVIPLGTLFQLDELRHEMSDLVTALTVVEDAVLDVYAADSPLFKYPEPEQPHLRALDGVVYALYKVRNEMDESFAKAIKEAIPAVRNQSAV